MRHHNLQLLPEHIIDINIDPFIINSDNTILYAEDSSCFHSILDGLPRLALAEFVEPPGQI